MSYDDLFLRTITLCISGVIFIFYLIYCIKNKEFLAFTLSKFYWISLSLGLFLGIILGSLIYAIYAINLIPYYSIANYDINDEIIVKPLISSFISFIIIFPFLFVFLYMVFVFFKTYVKKKFIANKIDRKIIFINFLFILFSSIFFIFAMKGHNFGLFMGLVISFIIANFLTSSILSLF